MGVMKNLVLEIADDPDVCRECGRLAKHKHHEPYRCQGNTAKRGNIPLCAKCHRKLHSQRNDFSAWGRKGGLKTASNPANWQRNLKQYRVKVL